jgi:Uma2 family endonuclease
MASSSSMFHKTTLTAYLAREDTNRPQELAYGVLREPPAPGFNHQVIVGRVFARLDRHVRRHRLGALVMSPIDVVLDARHHLVVQPDLAFVRRERGDICQTQIWGAPDLVVEVLSNGNARRDRTVKVAWYRKYGVRECWLIDPVASSIEVIDLTESGAACEYSGDEVIRSAVLPRLRLRPRRIFVPATR